MSGVSCIQPRIFRKSSNAADGSDGRKSYNAFINKNLDYLLLNYNCLNSIKFGKAEMNYRLFGRASGNTVISDNGRYLFLRSTVQHYGTYGSYGRLPDTEVQCLTTKLNRIYDHFKNEGFDEVYLSLIPSPATILQPKGYNMFIPSLQAYQALRIPVIDLYTPFKSDPYPESLYRLGDTHWNNKGMHLWIRLVNQRLVKY